jgi:hypothetical protein
MMNCSGPYLAQGQETACGLARKCWPGVVRMLAWALLGLGLCMPAWPQKPADGLTHTCVRIMRDTAFNETIEKMCSFKGDVSERFKDTFKKRKCVSKVNQAEQDRIKAEVYANTTEQKNMVGLKDFCLVHKSAYHNL